MQQIYSPQRKSRNEILAMCTSFIETLFNEKLEREKKRIWAEKTPHNILHMGFLRRLFPSARFVCIHRDPRDVVASLLKKNWAPNDVNGAICWLSSVYKSYWNQRKQHPEIPMYELTLESLVSNPKEQLKKLANFLDLDESFDISNMDLSLSNQGRWKNEIDPARHEDLQSRLGKYMEQYGYS